MVLIFFCFAKKGFLGCFQPEDVRVQLFPARDAALEKQATPAQLIMQSNGLVQSTAGWSCAPGAEQLPQTAQSEFTSRQKKKKGCSP